LKKKISVIEMDYKKNVMATITRTTNEWINGTNGKNKNTYFWYKKMENLNLCMKLKLKKLISGI